ncbi:hypothetical protein INT48_003129 [Thamnidium elegans]|uniref:CCHC-type domain-containing protein n=1 Tax=Thamnidium elegans TaxID=101142 RepID=A0A8H7VRB0_9FUNG|nr:hypothetical protein INT48_003129 [Thamnidium elegans]
MLSPLHITHGTLPPDNALTSPLTNLSPPPIESSSQSTSETFSRSYASVTAATTPGLHSSRSTSKSSTNQHRKTYPLFRSPALGGRSNDLHRNVIHRTGTTEHSVFYQVPKHQLHLRPALALKLSETFPQGVGLGLTSTEDMNGTTLEITLATKEDCEFAIANPIVAQNSTFHADPAVHPDQALLRVNLTKLPIWNWDKLRNSLMNNLSRYGIVREIVLYLDDWSGNWFTGNGHVYIERPLQTEKNFETSTYKIPLEGENTFCLGTWTNMGKHCVYCKQTGHYRKECTEAPEEKRRCYQCGNSGHIARNCFRTKTDNTTSNKRRRTPIQHVQTEVTLPVSPSTAVAEIVENDPAQFIDRIVINDELDTQSADESEPTSTHLEEEDNESMITTSPSEQFGDTSPAVLHTRTQRSKAGATLRLKDFVISTNTKSCQCGGTDHRRTTSNKCRLNKKHKQNSAQTEPAMSLAVLDHVDNVTNETPDD